MIVICYPSRCYWQALPPQLGWRRLFDTSTDFFTKTSVTRKLKVNKLFRKLEMNRLSEGYKRAIDKIWGPIAKHGFFGQNPGFWAKKKLISNHVLSTTGKSCVNPFPK